LKRITYFAFGNALREARKKLRDPETGQRLSVKDVSKLLNVTPSFIYQVEQGIRKPNDGQIAQWASVYEVDENELWKHLQKIPMFHVAMLRGDSEPIPPSPFSELTKDEQSMLLPFLDYVQWKINQKSMRKVD
jgi:transcriptional regulator with XRE-family HTH domain